MVDFGKVHFVTDFSEVHILTDSGKVYSMVDFGNNNKKTLYERFWQCTISEVHVTDIT